MRFSNSITARVVVWLAGLLVPLETLPLMACDCGSIPKPTPTAVSHTTPACPHCSRGNRATRPCCQRAVTSSHRCCCCGAASCCCMKGTHSAVNPCQCASNSSAPTPAPISNDSQTDHSKAAAASCAVVAAGASVIPPSPQLHSNHHGAFIGSTTLKRLSTLCRLVV